MLVEFAACLYHQFSSSRRRGSPDISDKVRNGEISLVSNTGNDGDGRRSNSASHNLFVEAPQIFHGAAAARQDHHVDTLPAIEKLQAANNFERGAITLDAHRINREMHVGK